MSCVKCLVEHFNLIGSCIFVLKSHQKCYSIIHLSYLQIFHTANIIHCFSSHSLCYFNSLTLHKTLEFGQASVYSAQMETYLYGSSILPSFLLICAVFCQCYPHTCGLHCIKTGCLSRNKENAKNLLKSMDNLQAPVQFGVYHKTLHIWISWRKLMRKALQAVYKHLAITR